MKYLLHALSSRGRKALAIQRWIASSLWLLAMTASPAFAQMPPPPPSITVTGEASETVAPDQAVITASLVSRDKSLLVAKKNNDAQLEKVAQIAKEFSIAKDKIATSNVNISPEYAYVDDGQKQVLKGYVVSRTLRITMDKLAQHEQVLSALVDAKVDQVSGVQFTLADPDALSQKLRVRAVLDAKAKAAELAQAAGAKLGKPIAINATGVYTIPQPYDMEARRMAATAAAPTPPSFPGTLEMRMSVTAVFALE